MKELDLKRLTLLAELEEAEREAVAEHLEPIDLEPGALIFDEGEQGEGLVFIAAGSVRVVTGRAAQVGPAHVVFRLTGRPGERVALTFKVGER